MTEILHASCVALPEGAVLILGPSGAGKSALALKLIALGATLVSDDRTEVAAEGDGLLASPPATIAGLIEARGVGILRLPHLDAAPLRLVVDLASRETERLPPLRHICVAGVALPLVHGVAHDHFPSAILCYLKGTRFG